MCDLTISIMSPMSSQFQQHVIPLWHHYSRVPGYLISRQVKHFQISINWGPNKLGEGGEEAQDGSVNPVKQSIFDKNVQISKIHQTLIKKGGGAPLIVRSFLMKKIPLPFSKFVVQTPNLDLRTLKAISDQNTRCPSRVMKIYTFEIFLSK